MMTARDRTVLLAVLSIFTAAFVSACGSGDKIADRRARGERDALESAPLDDDADSFWSDDGSAASSADDDMTASSSFTDDDSASSDDAEDEAFFDDVAASGSTSAAADDDSGFDLAGDDDDDDLLLGGDAEDDLPPIRATGEAGDILQEMRRDATVNRSTSEFWEERGDQAFANRDYAAARDAYRTALDYAAGNDAAREKWNKTLSILNERQGELSTLPDRILETERIGDEQMKIEVRRNLEAARKRFQEGDLELATRLARTALDMARANPDLPLQSAEDEAEKLLEEIDQRQGELARRRREEQLEEVDEKIRREFDDEEVRRKKQVQELLSSARRQIRLRNYRKALEACESVLQLDPSNRVAIYWRNLSRDQLNNQQVLALMKEQRESVRALELDYIRGGTPFEDIEFPTVEEWNKVVDRSNRAAGVSLDEPESVKMIRNRLEANVIQDINFDDTPLSEVIETFRQIAGVNMILDSRIDGSAEEFRISQQITGLSAMSALNLILETKNLAYTFEDNTMVISSKDDVLVATTFNVYNVSDLLSKIRDFVAPEIRLRSSSESQGGESPISFTADDEEEGESLDPDQLIELIQETTGGEDAWSEEFSIEVSRQQLFVDAPPELHRKVKSVLDSLRQDSDLFVIVEARFIDVFDDFLEDIGIDSRALGLVNNRGEPFGNVINNTRTGGNDLGIVEGGDPEDIELVQGLERWAGRVQHVIDGFSGTVRGDRLTAGNGLAGGTFQATWLEPFQVNVILRLVQEEQDVRQLTAPVVTAHNNERVYVSVITQRAYIADYELVSGGTGFAIIEVADPVVQTFQEGVILDVDPTISHDKKYVTLDVRPTLATLIGGVISTINISLGSFTNVAFQVPIGIPQISLQQSFTSVTVPNGGTVLLGGFKSMDSGQFESYLPIIGKIPILKNLARRKATIEEKRSLVILLSARIVDLRGEEQRLFSTRE